MEDCNNIGGVQEDLTRKFLASLKSMLSGRSTPQNSPSFRRLHSSLTTPRRENKGGGGSQWFWSNKLILWLILITLWAYLAFLVQSKWENGDKEEEFSGFKSREIDTTNSVSHQRTHQHHQDLVANERITVSFDNDIVEDRVRLGETMHVSLAKKENSVPSYPKTSPRKRRRRRARKRKPKGDGIGEELLQEPEIPMTNSTYGFLIGPFGSIEDRILNSEKKYSVGCNRKGEFARLVRSRRFVLVFHELSMTGAPLSMMELGTELLSCGATVLAVVLSKKGGLMQELGRRRIKVLEDKADLSFRTAMKSDLVVAGSAVCASWIEQYIDHFPAGANQVAWWIMENRREYFDRSKHVLQRVKMLAFLSELQSKQWRKWCEEESLILRSQPVIIPLSVNDELALVAGIPSTLTGSFSADEMSKKRKLLRDSVRREIGLTDNDMLVISLSSINPGKGQFMLLKSASSLVEHENLLDDDKEMKKSYDIGNYLSSLARNHHIRRLLRLLTDSRGELNDVSSNSMINRETEVLSQNNRTTEQTLKILIGSVGSKSNKVEYVKGILHFLAQHPKLSKSVIWTPATTRVASLYSAADGYVINSQGLGETFGRVTIEAMAFGIPVLGTNAGGTQEIVEHNVTGLLHPIGRQGNHVLARNLRFLLENRPARERMGRNGRRKVESMYLKHHMYEKFVEVLVRNVIEGLKPAFCMVMVQVAYAGLSILYKLVAEDGMSLSVLTAYRTLFATSFVVPLAFFMERKSKPKITSIVLLQAFFCGLFGVALAQNLFLGAVAIGGATYATAMTNLIPGATFILAVCFGLERLNIRTSTGKAKVVGTLMGIGGAMILTFYKSIEIHIWSNNNHNYHNNNVKYKMQYSHKMSSNNQILGSSLAFGTCLCYAIWLIIQVLPLSFTHNSQCYNSYNCLP